MTERVILTCSCHHQDKKAAEAFKLLFGEGETLPEIIRGRDRIYKLYQDTQNEHIKAISKLGGKYSYYIELDENDTIIKEIDLITGKRIK